jgi:hypothetical protein
MPSIKLLFAGILFSCAGLPAWAIVAPYTQPELDLWRLEADKFYRSPVVLAPNLQSMAYSEVVFLADRRRTASVLYWVPLPEEGGDPTKRFDPETLLRARQEILRAMPDPPFNFTTLTVVDWSPNGQLLLVKQRLGLLHVGLRTSRLWVLNLQRPAINVYPDIQRAVEYHILQTTGQELHPARWDLQPLGWQNNTTVVVRAVYADGRPIGDWLFDVRAGRIQRLAEPALVPPVNGFSPKREITP